MATESRKRARRRYQKKPQYRAYQKRYWETYKRNPDYALGLKLAACDAYGGRFCAWCGEDDVQVLTVDHINNDGAKHRKEVRYSMYLWLKTNKYPQGFQILCFNCNMSKYFNGGVLPIHRKDKSRRTFVQK